MVFKTQTSDAPGEDYESIFARRGREYNRGMQSWPHARAREFAVAIHALAPRSGETILDAPAGGGYMHAFLPQDRDLRLIEIDPASEFRCDHQNTPHSTKSPQQSEALIAGLDAIPLGPDTCDGIVSVAGLHHATNLSAIFTEFHRVLRPRGRLIILEVEADSRVDRFLNGFVDQHNSTGHSGVFIDKEFRRCLGDCGFVTEQDTRQSYTWDFPDSSAMARFTQLVFGLDLADEATILEGIGDILGFAETVDGCLMNWELQLIACHTDPRP